MHRTLVVALAGGVAAAALLAGAPAAATTRPTAADTKTPSPSAVLIGGNLKENATILQRIVDLADPDGAGPKKARIAIVTAAATPAKTAAQAADPDENNAAANGLYYSALFAKYGAETYAVPIDPSVDFAGDAYVPANAHSAEVAAQVRASTGVFFGGGDQMDYVRTLFTCAPAPLDAYSTCADTPVMAAIREVAARGLVSGVSAGLTIQQGADMVTGGESYQAWRDGAQPGYLDDASALGYLPYGGFGFVDSALIDSHFTTWGREGRAVKLALATHHPYVLGVDETTAVVLDRRTGQGTVIGEHGASLIDVRDAVTTATGVSGVRWSYLNAGDTITLRAHAKVHAGRGSVAAPATGVNPPVRADVWDSIDGDGGTYGLRDLAQEAATSVAGTGTGLSFETGPQFATTVARDHRTTVWTTAGGKVSFAGLTMAIDPVH